MRILIVGGYLKENVTSSSDEESDSIDEAEEDEVHEIDPVVEHPMPTQTETPSHSNESHHNSSTKTDQTHANEVLIKIHFAVCMQYISFHPFATAKRIEFIRRTIANRK